MLTGLVIFNLALILVVVGVAARLLPRGFYHVWINLLHNTIGITTPTEQQARYAFLFWIISILVIVDVVVLLLVYVW